LNKNFTINLKARFRAFLLYIFDALSNNSKQYRRMKKLLALIFIQVFIVSLFAQAVKPKLKGWHLLNFQQDGYMGTGVKEAYELLKGRKSTTVIVAVIDSGIDTLHEDLVPNLWVNKKEITRQWN